MSFAVLARLLLVAAPLMAMLAGCELAPERAEFAPPQSRWPGTLPSPLNANEAAAPRLISYCYRTLAQVDCFPAPRPERTGYLGTYPDPNSVP
jgi:hypothetical protein